MQNEQVYLKPNIVVEPLYDRWYAWSHLISPATAAMNVVGRHLKIMESYIDAPDIHAEAVRNPMMKGGPFMDLPEKAFGQVEDLFNITLSQQQDLLDFSKAVVQLDKLLREEAIGFGLEKFYDRVPELLRGYVELYYDRENNAGYRFFESLLYYSKFYKKSSQSIALWETKNDERPFCLSTPRLEEDHVVHLQIAFDDIAIDELATMKRFPQDFERIKDRLKVPNEKAELFRSFFTSEAPPSYNVYRGDKIRMRYFGHACILIETKDIAILVDPLISYYGYHSDIDHFSDMDLPEKLDYVLITHNHQDHILFETLLPLRHKIGKLIVPTSASGKLEDPDLKLMFQQIGFKNVIPILDIESVIDDEVSITGIPFLGEHSDLNIISKSCYHIKIGDFKLMFFADSRVLDANVYKHVHQIVGDVDVIFLGMECDGAPLSWLYGPLYSKKVSRDHDNSRRLAGSDCEKGMTLVDIFNPSEVYVYAMGQEPWVEFISSIKYTDESNPIVQSNMLIDQCSKQGICAERLYGEKEILYMKNRKNAQSVFQKS